MNQLTIPKKTLSTELSTNINLSNDQIYTVGKKVKKYKKQINATIDTMEDILEKETEKERDEVAKALQNLHNKVAKIKEEKNYKSLQDELKYLENKLNITMENVFHQYSKSIRKIYKAYPNQIERNKKLSDFHQVIGDAFLTKDEKKVLSLMKEQIKEIPHNVVNIPLLEF